MTTRRRFLAGTGSAAGLVLMQSQSVFGAPANDRIRLGIIGCGGRGQFIARKFFENAENRFEITAIQDPFADRLVAMKDRYDIEPAKEYSGMNAWQDMMTDDVDAIVITSPPLFHPDQVEAAVDAGKHVWLAKPVAADAHGCERVRKASHKAKGKSSFLVDFQTRNSPNFKEIVRRVHNGAIGDIVLGHVYYHAGRLGVNRAPVDSDDEFKLRNWVFFKNLSGDIIVEQNVHVLDVANWYIGANPVKAVGRGGRKARTDVGDCYDHFVVAYTYPNGITVDFSSAQFTKGYDDLCIRMYGSAGTAQSHYCGAQWGRGPVRITGDNPWPGVDRDNTWDAVDNNVTDFVKAFRTGQFINHGDYACDSTLVGVLGRVAAYREDEVSWDEVVSMPQEYEIDLSVG